MNLTPRQLRRVMWLWPPYLGAGVAVEAFADDGAEVVVRHRPNPLTKNAFGTVFGGTMLSMTDPFYVLMARTRLGPDYVVWDVGAQIEFVRLARGTVRARMTITESDYDEIVRRTADGSKHVHTFDADITDDDGELVASVRRDVYVRRMKAADATETVGSVN